METKIEFSKNWFEINDSKIIYSNQPELDKIEEDKKLAGENYLSWALTLEIRITKKGNYLINDSKIEENNPHGIRSCTSLSFANGWRLITKQEAKEIMKDRRLSFVNQQKSHNDQEV